MAKAIGRAVGRSVRVVPTPTWLFMKTARMAGMPIDLMSNVRYYIDDHKLGAFELGAPTSDVLDVTGSPAEDLETIARRYAAQPRSQRTFGNWVHEFAQFMTAPLIPGFNLDRYDREQRRPMCPCHSSQLVLKSGNASTPSATPPGPRYQAATRFVPPEPAAVDRWNSNRRTVMQPQICLFRKHRIQPHCLGNRHDPIHLA